MHPLAFDAKGIEFCLNCEHGTQADPMSELFEGHMQPLGPGTEFGFVLSHAPRMVMARVSAVIGSISPSLETARSTVVPVISVGQTT